MLSTSSPRRARFIAFGLALAALPLPAAALDLVGLTDKNQLVVFNAANLGAVRTMPITGAGARIIGIDFRPANKQLYGVGADSVVYVIDPANGRATSSRKLSVAFDASKGAVVDFNPQADRLRLMATGGQNLRVNVDTGEATVDKPLAYKAGDAGAGKAPVVTAGAYINSFAGATQTQLFDYDSAAGTWVAAAVTMMASTQRSSPMSAEPSACFRRTFFTASDCSVRRAFASSAPMRSTE